VLVSTTCYTGSYYYFSSSQIFSMVDWSNCFEWRVFLKRVLVVYHIFPKDPPVDLVAIASKLHFGCVCITSLLSYRYVCNVKWWKSHVECLSFLAGFLGKMFSGVALIACQHTAIQFLERFLDGLRVTQLWKVHRITGSLLTCIPLHCVLPLL